MKKIQFFLLLVLFTYSLCYLPGFVQKTYKIDETVEVKTRKLATRNNLPYDFYSLKFCTPNPKLYSANNLGEIFFGDRIENSLYQVKFSLTKDKNNE
jgi:transmembrane 9 superfamily member 2/4